MANLSQHKPFKSFNEHQSPFLFNPYRYAAPGVGGWVEVARTTLTSSVIANPTGITVSSIPNNRYYMVITTVGYTSPGGTVHHEVGYGSADTGNNYSYRASVNGGADYTGTNNSFSTALASGTQDAMKIDFVANKSDKEKLFIEQAVFQGGSGSGSAPNRGEQVFKWDNTSNPIDVIHARSSSGGGASYTAGSEVVVLGWDPADTHTNNFWEELASVNATASSTSIDTGSFTAKKYLWIQAFVKSTGNTMGSISATFNNDTATTYANRYSDNGGADGTITSNQGLILVDGGNLATNESALINFFIVNNSSNEKLVIGHAVKRNTAGAANAPTRRETAQKWANTSSQITSFKIVRDSGSGTFDTNSIIKVWGAD